LNEKAYSEGADGILPPHRHKMNNQRIQELEEKISDLKKRWSAHSVPPAMVRELDDLEEELAKALAEALEQVQQEKNHA
jgi:thioesterase domain-containing protein